jgi:arylsulfatase
MFSSDNGAAMNSWPDGGNTPFAGEKGLGKEGAFRVPMLVKWPGRIPEGTTTGEFMSMEDWIPTLMACAGEPGVKEKLLTRYEAGDQTYTRIHLDGYDQTDLITGKGPSKRKEFFYFTETKLHGTRFGDWKFLFTKQDKWLNGVQQDLLTPLVTNLKLDPFERFNEARGYDEWCENHAWTYGPAFAQVGVLIKSLKEYPPRMASLEFDIDESMKAITPKGD